MNGHSKILHDNINVRSDLSLLFIRSHITSIVYHCLRCFICLRLLKSKELLTLSHFLDKKEMYNSQKNYMHLTLIVTLKELGPGAVEIEACAVLIPDSRDVDLVNFLRYSKYFKFILHFFYKSIN